MKYLFWIIIFISLFICATFYLNTLPVSYNTKAKEFTINSGDGIISIADRLEQNNLIRNKYAFIVLAKIKKLNNSLKPGTFVLSPSLSTLDTITQLARGGRQDYWLKIIEGQRLTEITPRFDDKYEGYIFPDSYLIPNDYSIDQIYQVISKNFNQKVSQAKIGMTSNLSDRDVVVLASLLEREARTLSSKQTVAGILINRLKINMALQLDATVQYAKGTWEPIRKSDLSIDSLYNTYKYPGLPPGPICNPGYDSFYAAYHPTETKYMYYLSDSSGIMHYATTLAEHNANVAKYLR